MTGKTIANWNINIRNELDRVYYIYIENVYMQSMPHVDLVTFEYCDINLSCLHLSVIIECAQCRYIYSFNVV